MKNENLWQECYACDRKKWFLDTLALIRDRFHTLKDFTSLGRAYFADDFMIDPKPLEKNVLKFAELQTWLPELAARYEKLTDFTLEETERVARELAEELSIKPGLLINAMRTVVTGQLAGPSMFDIVLTIGRETVVRRLRDVEKFFNRA